MWISLYSIAKVAFGGADLRLLYATTARKGLTPNELAARVQAGSLFAIRRDAGITLSLAIS